MKLVSLEDAWEVFLEQPTTARFATLREFVIDQPDYSPCSSILLELTDLLHDGQHQQLLRRVETLMPAWAICPRVHFLAGCAAEAIGDFEEVELCRFLTTTCLRGIRDSGDGSQRRPWLATYPSDVQDCLTSLRLTVARRELVEADDCLLEAVQADDGRTYWFEVAELVAAGGEVSSRSTLRI